MQRFVHAVRLFPQIVRLFRCASIGIDAHVGLLPLILVLLPLYCVVAAPETPVFPKRDLKFDHYNLAEGLSQSSVFAVLQDRYGFLWIGTQDGLNRYDGYRFTHYRHNPDNPHSLASNFISALYEDRSGTLWVGTQEGGLHVFDRTTEGFTRYRTNPAEPFSTKFIGSNFIRGITEDASGTLWLATLGAVSTFNKNTGEWRHITSNTKNPDDAKSLSSPATCGILRDNEGMMWIATLGGGLNRINPQTGIVTRINDHSAGFRISGRNVTALYQDNIGNIWVGTDKGVDILRLREQKSEYLPLNETMKTGGVERPVRAFQQESDSVMWIGVEFGGLTVLNMRTGKQSSYRHEQTRLSSLSNDFLWCIYRDKQGAFWVGTQGGGVNVFNPNARKFTSFRQEINNPFSLNNNFVRAMSEDGKGTLWVGTEGGGLSRYDRLTQRFTAYTFDEKARSGISHNIVRAIVYDAKRDALWVGTGGGLNKLDLKSGVFTVFRADKNNPHTISDDAVRTLLLDDDGTLWVGTDNGGVNHFNPETKRFRAYQHNPNDASSLSFNAVLSLHKDRLGTLWVGTLRGLNKLNAANGTFTVFAADNTKATMLQSGNIRAIHEDRKGRFWIATWGGGLHQFDRQSGHFEVFREKDGLPNDAVYGILEDKSGHLWLTTNNGLARFNPDERSFRTYTVEDGLQSNEFNGGAYFQGASGRMYVGGVNGLSEFCPETITDNDVPPAVVITGFKKFNKPVQLWKDLNAEPEITLPHDDNFFSIEFAALSFANAKKNRYLYKMDGFDRQWIDAGTSKEAAYTNLDPGSYVFRVKACNNDGVWNEEGARLRISILPPWWMSLWFRAGIVLGFVGTGGAWFWMRLRNERRRRAELERLVHIRTEQLETSNHELSQANEEIQTHIQTLSEQAWEIATMNTQLQSRNQELERLNTEKNEFLGIAAHDLKNPLSSIVLMTEMLQMQHKTLASEQVQEKLGRIESTAMRMRDIITNLLDVNALESGALTLYPAEFDAKDLVRDVVEEYQQRATEKNITLHLDIADAPEHGIYADYAKTHEVLENLVSNAVKYSPTGKKVNVRVVVGHSSDDNVRNTNTEAAHRTNDQRLMTNDQSTNDQSTNDQFTKPQATNNYLRIEVADEGPGISDEDMKRLFGKFARLTAQPTGGEDSTGLGLSIVKKIVEAMNGRVWCESVLGAGATFIVELPRSGAE